MQQQRFTSTRIKTVFDEQEYKLWGDPVGGSRKSPSMSFYVTGRNVRCDVYTNLDGDVKNGLIRVDPGMTRMHNFLDLLEEYTDPSKEAGSDCIVIKNTVWVGKGQSSEKPEPVGKLVVGKVEDGRIFVALFDIDDSRPKIRFFFGGTRMASFVRSNGEAYSAGEISTKMAKAWLRAYRDQLPAVASRQYEHWQSEQAKKEGGGDQSSGGGRQSYKGSNDDESLPF